MKRRGFLSRMLGGLAAALGLGATRWKPVRGESISYDHEDVVIHGMGARTLEKRLKAMIALRRHNGEEVRYFHMNEKTLLDMWREIGVVFDIMPGYQAIVYEGVKYWGDERMFDGEILVSDEGIDDTPA